ncbi:M50 family metallopeptidase [Solicola sp. PLA-1-18]|uniref:site-2 protease family protein n=1 Tax=Solicola sp. PLA-1-18 TaxID=3380532 RepID=UPI003B7FE851
MTSPQRPPGTIRLGTIAGVDVLVRASWFVVAVLISYIVSPRIDMVAPGLGGLVYVAGLAFAVLLYLSVLLHEVSHAVMAKFFGFEVRSVTLHFLGGVTEIEGESDTAWREFWIAVVGPLTSIAIAAASFGVTFLLPEGLLLLAFQSLALANAVVGVLNLLPGMPLDGGRVLRALVWGVSGTPHTGTIVSAWAGRVLAVLVLGYPLLISELLGSEPTIIDWVLAAVVAAFLWGGASQALLSARLRKKLPALHGRTIARRVVAVTPETTVAAAVEAARTDGAAGVVVVDAERRPVAVVDEEAVLAMPDLRRAHLAVTSVARTLHDGQVLPDSTGGEEMLRSMQSHPAPYYVLVTSEGAPYGLLTTRDVDRAFSEV